MPSAQTVPPSRGEAEVVGVPAYRPQPMIAEGGTSDSEPSPRITDERESSHPIATDRGTVNNLSLTGKPPSKQSHHENHLIAKAEKTRSFFPSKIHPKSNQKPSPKITPKNRKNHLKKVV